MTLYEHWKAAIAKLTFRHGDRSARPTFELFDGAHPVLNISVKNTRCSVTDEPIGSLAVSSVELTFWPGETVALRWLAAGYAGYIQHEALELVTLADGTRPIDPHADPKFDRGLRYGLPTRLTPETLLQSFEAIMPAEVAREMIHAG